MIRRRELSFGHQRQLNALSAPVSCTQVAVSAFMFWSHSDTVPAKRYVPVFKEKIVITSRSRRAIHSIIMNPDSPAPQCSRLRVSLMLQGVKRKVERTESGSCFRQ